VAIILRKVIGFLGRALPWTALETPPPFSLKTFPATPLSLEFFISVLFQLCGRHCVAGWVDQDEVTVMPQFASDVRLSVAVGMIGSSQQEWSDYVSMFARSVRHVHHYQISHCPG